MPGVSQTQDSLQWTDPVRSWSGKPRIYGTNRLQVAKRANYATYRVNTETLYAIGGRNVNTGNLVARINLGLNKHLPSPKLRGGVPR